MGQRAHMALVLVVLCGVSCRSPLILLRLSQKTSMRHKSSLRVLDTAHTDSICLLKRYCTSTCTLSSPWAEVCRSCDSSVCQLGLRCVPKELQGRRSQLSLACEQKLSGNCKKNNCSMVWKLLLDCTVNHSVSLTVSQQLRSGEHSLAVRPKPILIAYGFSFCNNSFVF